MTPTIKRSFGVIAFFAIGLLLATGVRSAESQQPVPATAGQAKSEGPTVVNPQHLAQDNPSQGMMGRMGMVQMGKGPGMIPGMRGMMGMPGGMRMPGMQTGEMGMIPMMDELMRMAARNPKLAGKMLQMRADMMRAIADVLTKYGKEMESGQWPVAKDKGGEGD